MRRAIALLITLMFIMAITLSIGVGLSYTKRAQNTLADENFLLQSNVIINDVLAILKNFKELQLLEKDTSGAMMYGFLAQSSFIPLESSGIQVVLEIKSARSKVHLSTLLKADKKSFDLARVNAFRNYLTKNMINSTYVDIILDGLGGVKEDLSYNSNIFNSNDTLFRDYIVDANHFEVFNDFYKNSFYDNSLSLVEFDKLLYFSDDANASSSYKIDLNYATPEVWELLLGVDKPRAEQLALGGGTYSKEYPPELSDEELGALSDFDTSYYELFLDVKVEILQGKSSANIAFEYDIVQQKGYNFSYEI